MRRGGGGGGGGIVRGVNNCFSVFSYPSETGMSAHRLDIHLARKKTFPFSFIT